MTLDRRRFLAACSRAGITSALLPGILYTLAAQAEEGGLAANGETAPATSKEPAKITSQMLDEAAALAGVGPFTAVQKQMMLDGLTSQRDSYAPIRALKMANSVPPAYVFHPLPAAKEIKYTPAKKCTDSSIEHGEIIYSSVLSSTPKAPAYIEDLAFSSISEIANLMRDRVITSLDLTKMYLERLKRYDSKLHFIITLTEERALAQARAF